MGTLLIPELIDVIAVVARTTLIFLFTYFTIRILGKKSLSQFTIVDVLLIIALGSAVGDVMIYGERTIPIIIALIAIMTVAFLIKSIDSLIINHPSIEKLAKGEPTVLVVDGKVDDVALSKEDMTLEELSSLLRENGYDKVTKLKQVVLETDGHISVLEKRTIKPKKKK